MSDVLDIAPLIQRRRQTDCYHPTFIVDDTTADLRCGACEKPLDPWWVLRCFARLNENINADVTAKRAEVARLTTEIAALEKKRDALLTTR